ncbi:MAG: hypothetical protein IJB78_02975 [Oscillospiraceae bacterium]|nr:hypothetical protein [Oscillospiraceae bacterium]
MMTYVLGVLAGLVLGALVALINYNIMKNAVKKNSDKAVLLCNFSRTAVDIVSLGAVFLLRNALPFSFEACIVAMAAIMGLGTVYFSFKIAKS